MFSVILDCNRCFVVIVVTVITEERWRTLYAISALSYLGKNEARLTLGPEERSLSLERECRCLT